MTALLWTAGLWLVCLGLFVLSASALRRATQRSPVLVPVTVPSISLRSVRQSPESIAAATCRDLATGLCDAVLVTERGRSLRVSTTEIPDAEGRRYEMFALEPHGRQWLIMVATLDELDLAISREIREWRSSPEAMERDCRWGEA